MIQSELSYTEENYIKTIFHLSTESDAAVSTNAIADAMQTKAASVTDMIKRLGGKELVHYKKYYGVTITEEGKRAALRVIRKHRLWETFLVDKLHFNWDEVHEIAEQLEHIQSSLLIKKLDEYLGYPKVDPHGDPIPLENGEMEDIPQVLLSELKSGDRGIVRAVRDSSSDFLQYLDRTGISIGATLRVLALVSFDNSVEIEVNNAKSMFISRQVAENLWIRKSF